MHMMVFVSIIIAVMIILLVLLEAGRLSRTTTSLYELRRLKAAKDPKATTMLRREELLVQSEVLKTPLRALLMVGIALLLVYALGWNKGVITAVAVALLYARFAQLGGIQKVANRLYAKREVQFLSFVEKNEKLLRLLGGKALLSQKVTPLSSREELLHLLEVSNIFSDEDKRMLKSVLDFSDHSVGDVMTKKHAMVTVKPGDLLGPLVLDDLHKTKHEIFPVEKNNEIIGLLDIRDHVALRRKDSVYVRDVMHSGVVRINQSEPLDEALKVLVAAKQPYLVVVDDDSRTTGLLGLGDVIRMLTGWTRR